MFGKYSKNIVFNIRIKRYGVVQVRFSSEEAVDAPATTTPKMTVTDHESMHEDCETVDRESPT